MGVIVMRKSIVTLALAICVLLSFSTSAFASTESETPPVGITPFWSYTSSTVETLSISASGTATGTAKLTGYQGTTTKVITYLYLERYANGSWSTVQSWSQTDDSYRATLQGTYNVSKGYKYRVKASYYAYSGNSSGSAILN